MLSLPYWLVFASLSLQTIAFPSSLDGKAPKCISPRIRKEWRTLTIPERVKFVQAVNCLMSAPPKLKKNFPIVENRYDDFVAVHVNTTQGEIKFSFPSADDDSGNTQPFTGAHATGHILCWHRYTVSLWEDALVNQCGWQGGIPYWNWYLDTPDAGGSFLESPIFDPVSGFGGNGKKVAPAIGGFMNMPSFGANTGGGCLLNGPFANRTLRIGPFGTMKPNNTRCLTRNFNPQIAEASATKATIARIMKAKTYKDLMYQMEHPPPPSYEKGVFKFQGDVHAIGHSGVGGEMGDPLNSINDPLFFMHHGAMDYLWAIWQGDDDKRLHDLDVSKSGTKKTESAATIMSVGVLGPDRKASELADTQNRDGTGVLCYKYEGLNLEKYLS